MRKVIILLSLFMLACQANNYQEPFKIASIGFAGSTNGKHSLRSIWITDINGGSAGFGDGSVNGYHVASADIGGIGVPKKIEGYWANNRDGVQHFYKISAPIDSVLAEKKIKKLLDYYQNFTDQL